MIIRFTDIAGKQLALLPKHDRNRILAKIEQYAKIPESLANQVKKLQGSSYYRLRVGDYRVMFAKDGTILKFSKWVIAKIFTIRRTL